MANSDLIRGGTVTVEADGVTVTGQGVSWASVREGDFFGSHRGLAVPIEKIEGNVITLAYPWRGPAQNAAPYAIQPKADAVRFAKTVRELIEMLAGGELHAIAAAGSAPNKMPYYTGDGAAALTDLSARARDYLAANFFPVQQGGGLNHLGNKIKLGWASDPRWGLKLDVDGYDQGYVWIDVDAPRSLAVSGYQRLPSGLIIQWGYIYDGTSDTTVVFPLAFPTFPIYAGAVLQNPLATGGLTAHITAINATSVTFRKRSNPSQGGAWSASSDIMRWFAIGY